MRKIGIFLALFAWVVGSGATFGYALYYKFDAPLIVCLIIVFLFSFVGAKKYWKVFIS